MSDKVSSRLPIFIGAVRTSSLTGEQETLLDEHERALDEGLLRGRQMEFLMTRRAPVVAAIVALAAALLFGLLAATLTG